jgi:DNA repair exonuclease SbcCD ATPase subunit
MEALRAQAAAAEQALEAEQEAARLFRGEHERALAEMEQERAEAQRVLGEAAESDQTLRQYVEGKEAELAAVQAELRQVLDSYMEVIDTSQKQANNAKRIAGEYEELVASLRGELGRVIGDTNNERVKAQQLLRDAAQSGQALREHLSSKESQLRKSKIELELYAAEIEKLKLDLARISAERMVERKQAVKGAVEHDRDRRRLMSQVEDLSAHLQRTEKTLSELRKKFRFFPGVGADVESEANKRSRGQ